MPAASAQPCLVTGFDGSPASRAAVSHAVRRAGSTGRVVVVHACKPPADRYGQPNTQQLLDSQLAGARERLDRLPDEVPELGSADWHAEIVLGPAGKAIADVAEVEAATEIVVGTRGVGRARALLGSVAHDVLRRAGCPVVVIPERAVMRSAQEPRPIPTRAAS